MNTVIIVNLNGVAYHLEEAGYHILKNYLDGARVALKDYPDRDEIMSDLEQAIADKCAHFLQPHKNVVTQAEIKSVLDEMGPVQTGEGGPRPGGEVPGAGAAPGPTPGSDAGAGPGAQAQAASTPRRLYQIREGAMISGVCTGLAHYFDVDVTLIRIAFVVLVFLTGGFWLLVYLVMMLVVPFANTDEERAAAAGTPFTAQGVIDRAKKQYAEFRDGKEWRRHFRQQRREWRRRWSEGAYWWGHNLQQNVYHFSQNRGYFAQVFAGFAAVILAIAKLAIVVVLLAGIISLASTGGILGVPVVTYMPLWVGIVLLCLTIALISAPLDHARRALRWQKGGQFYPHYAAWEGVLWVWVLIIVGIVAFRHSLQVQEFLRHLPENLNHAWNNIVASWDHANSFHDAAKSAPALPAPSSAASAASSDFE